MKPENLKQHYAQVKLEEAARVVRQMIQELPILRKRLEKWKGERKKTQEVYQDLQQQHGRLSAAIDSAVLSLLEMELISTSINR